MHRPHGVRGLPSVPVWLVALGALGFGLPHAVRAQSPGVGIADGKIVGTTENGVQVFRGIPFAASPVGDRRWKPPAPVGPWGDATIRALGYGPRCMQVEYPTGSFFRGAPQPTSEDCLYLNVWTAAEPGEARPVMVWIHGGALTQGSGSRDVYDGGALARKGVVVVTINYRLGVFGYLAHAELSAESEHGSSGNYGVLDQIAALQWVQNNIAAFGGDPDRVTIFGESAGSWSVNAVMATPLAAGLFQRAIGESGGSFGPMPHLTEQRGALGPSEALGAAFVKAAGVASIEELRSLSAQRILDTFANHPEARGFRTRPSVDGWVFPTDIATMFAEGRHNDVPVLVGSNQDEMTTLTPPAQVPRTMAAYRKWLDRRLGEDADRFSEIYPVSRRSKIRDAFMRSRSDLTFGLQMRTWARAVTRGGSPAYLYYFTHHPPGPLREALKAYHASEIVYAFNNLGPDDREPADRKLADAMSSYWVNFATTGDPNGAGLPRWEPYDAESEPFLALAPEIRPGHHARKAELDFWEWRISEGRP